MGEAEVEIKRTELDRIEDKKPCWCVTHGAIDIVRKRSVNGNATYTGRRICSICGMTVRQLRMRDIVKW
jgi:hypothetical protein